MQNHDSTANTVLTLADAAAFLRVSTSTLYNLTRTRSQARREHKIPVLKVGRELRFRRAELEQWLATQIAGGAR